MTKITILAILAINLFIQGCASNDIYRSDSTQCEYKKSYDCKNHSIQIVNSDKDNEYHLSFVEYDDQGQLRSIPQKQDLLTHYNNLANDDVIVVTYVHGWHHSAEPEDQNIQKFRQMLSGLSSNETLDSKKLDRAKRKVLGVYIGWRGDSINIPYVNAITFWDRKSTAQDIGQHGLTSLLLSLEEIVNIRAGVNKRGADDHRSRMVVVGHSFGGAVLFDSIKKILADRFVNSTKGKTDVHFAQGFADLVVLINPAFEALRYSSLFDLSQEYCRSYFSGQLPKLAILTSEADYATKYAFPFGRFFSTLFESHNTVKRHSCKRSGNNGISYFQMSEGEADRTSVGHYDEYLTHRLELQDNKSKLNNIMSNLEIQSAWFSQQEGQPIEIFGSTKLIPKNRSTLLNPYLNIEVSKDIIPDHNEIWSDTVVGFLKDLIRVSTTKKDNSYLNK